MKSLRGKIICLSLITGLFVSFANTALADGTVNCSPASATCYIETSSVLWGLIKNEKKVPGQATSVEI
uniref:hypothetical protein n=1 Tax=Roseivirga sp. TaxID=1964215 RepID=UPI0040477167